MSDIVMDIPNKVEVVWNEDEGYYDILDAETGVRQMFDLGHSEVAYMVCEYINNLIGAITEDKPFYKVYECEEEE